MEPFLLAMNLSLDYDGGLVTQIKTIDLDASYFIQMSLLSPAIRLKWRQTSSKNFGKQLRKFVVGKVATPTFG